MVTFLVGALIVCTWALALGGIFTERRRAQMLLAYAVVMGVLAVLSTQLGYRHDHQEIESAEKLGTQEDACVEAPSTDEVETETETGCVVGGQTGAEEKAGGVATPPRVGPA